jgi:WD40 repeat protein
VAASGIAGLRGEAVVWEADSGREIRRYGQGHRDILYDAEFSPDGKLLATAGYDRRITIWETESGKEVRTIEGHNGAIFDLAFSPDGSLLASASADETVKLWRISDGERLDTLNQPQAEQSSVAFTPDGEHVIAGGADNRIRLWRVISRERPEINPLLQARFAHEQAIVRIAVAGDGRRLVSSSADRTIKAWTLPELEPLGVLGGQSDVAAALAIQPGLGALTAARMDGTVQSWPMTVWAGSVSNAVASTGIPRSPDSGEAPVGRPAEDGPVM